MKEHYECECGCTILQVWHDKDTTYCDESVYLSIYKKYHGNSIIRRLQLIWRIIKTGEPYEDEVVLSLDDARRLGNDLIKDLGK